MMYHSTHSDVYVLNDFARKTKRKKLKHPNTKFLHIFQMVGTIRVNNSTIEKINKSFWSYKKSLRKAVVEMTDSHLKQLNQLNLAIAVKT